jgi:tetratricopeptide (TPR) repeat protein
MYVPIIGLLFIATWGAIDAIGWTVEKVKPAPEHSASTETAPAEPVSSSRKRRDKSAVKEVVESLEPSRAHPIALAVPAIAIIIALFFACAVQVRYWDDNITLFQHAVDVTKDNDVALFNLGIALKREKHLKEASENFEEAVRIRPNYVNALIYLGLIQYEEGKYDKAIEYYQRALSFAAGHPNAGDAENNLGVVYSAQGKTEEALQHYRKGVEFAPKDANKRFNLGSLLIEAKRYDEAETQLREALRLDPNFARARAALEQVASLARENQATIDVPKLSSPEEYFKQGNALAEKTKYAEAAAYYEQALKLRPNYLDARINLGNALAVQGRLREAVTQFRETIKLRPENSDAHINLGNALSELGDLEASAESFKRGLSLKPNNVSALCALGYVLAKQNKGEEAIEQFSKALALDANCVHAREAIKSIKEQMQKK